MTLSARIQLMDGDRVLRTVDISVLNPMKDTEFEVNYEDEDDLSSSSVYTRARGIENITVTFYPLMNKDGLVVTYRDEVNLTTQRLALPHPPIPPSSGSLPPAP